MGDGTIQDPGYVRDAFARIADRYVTTNHVLSLGTDILWRRKVARIVRRWKPQRVLDVATGTGDLALEIQDVQVTVGANHHLQPTVLIGASSRFNAQVITKAC